MSGDEAPAGTDPRYQRLVGQVKILLRGEQRLLRTQRQVESQIRRYRAFNAFALEAPKGRDLEAVVACALRLLWPTFSVQAALAVLHPAGPGDTPTLLVGREGALWPLVPSDARFGPLLEAWVSRATVLPAAPSAGGLGPVLAVLDALVPAEPWEQRALRRPAMALPLGRREGGGVLLVCRCAGLSFHEETPVQADEDFLEMVSVHASSAIEIGAFQADLERRVQARTTDLAVTNRQLETSLRSLGEAQARLLAASRLAAVGQLAGEVAHEIANPLAALKANVAWLGRADGAPEDRAEALADALSAIGRISDSVWKLRRLEHPEDGEATPARPDQRGD